MNDTRRLILKILLWSLGATAAAGVAAVLVQSDMVARAAGTAFATSTTALLMLGLLARLEKPQFHQSLVLGIVALALDWLLVLALIWGVGGWFTSGGYRTEWMLVLWIWLILGAAVSGMFFLRLKSAPFTLVAGWTGLVVTAITFAAAMIASWSYWRNDYNDRWWGTAWMIYLCGLPAIASLVGLNTPVEIFSGDVVSPQGSERHWRWLGVIGGVLATVVALIGIWNDTHSGGEIFSVIICAGGFTGFAHLVLLAPLKQPQRWLGFGTLASGLTLVAAIQLAVWSDSEDWMERLIGAAVIATVCGSLALLVLARLNRRVEFTMTASQFLTIHLACPRCHRKQDLALGGAACAGCGLKIDVKVEEPRCVQCGYLLYMLQGDRCPECGAAIDTPAMAAAAGTPI